jgi:hypothetical protein
LCKNIGVKKGYVKMNNIIGSKIKSNIKRESNKFIKIVKKDFKSQFSNLIKSKISNEGSNSDNEELHLEKVFLKN